MRRLWLDAPYVAAKADLVTEVASANRCQCARDHRNGYALVVGSPADLDAVELLVTSLLLQAGTAMRRHAGSTRRAGASQARSFRQSFLVAYARRIGERLRVEADAVANEDASRMLPVLRDHEAKVTQAFEAMVPHSIGPATSANSHEGWVAGTAAAEVAQLDVRDKLTGT